MNPGPKPYFAPERIQAMYLSGLSLRAIAEETGLQYGKVRRGLLNAGVTMRQRGGTYS